MPGVDRDRSADAPALGAGVGSEAQADAADCEHTRDHADGARLHPRAGDDGQDQHPGGDGQALQRPRDPAAGDGDPRAGGWQGGRMTAGETRTYPAASTVRDRCRLLGLPTWRTDTAGSVVEEPAESGLAGLWLRSARVSQLITTAARVWSRQ